MLHLIFACYLLVTNSFAVTVCLGNFRGYVTFLICAITKCSKGVVTMLAL